MSLFSPSSLPIARYRFTLLTETPFRLTGYPGAMLRGAWGHALRYLACSTGSPECAGCPVREHCRYTQLFEPLPDTAQGAARDIPPPYIVQAALAQPRALARGDTWSFEMVLFGKALAELPLIIWAWQLAARDGLGDQQSPMCLVSVEHETSSGEWQPVWKNSPGSALGKPPRAPRVQAHVPALAMEQQANHHAMPLGASMTLLTPMRLQHKGRICEPQHLTANILLNSLWRKLELYMEHYTGLPLPAMPPRDGILLQPLSLARQRWERHSRRQQKAMRLDGMLGTLSLHGPLAEWWPWLWLGQYTHLGKNSSFGLGQYRLAPLRE
ncbi:CRISPR system precrRNA processing endoribonuclease RAMP protein Cas6 [Halomonas meridiana]|uniref:CRISPR system precrRNA processing endoribonuclease RAMP protein Cas6 n=1 Tax=Vreelandella aquamarina TaxID=77097 RepID=UPI00273BD65A|nr:CRISPR system precrRNA processing endoribonuclease RAMP protein Cas6 [Halomonas meridiana]MDP4559165.1 CRISPR system precrRNA processing endoribonuclease RAMP protein Cas6 [Halomonas meridiana]